LGIKERAFAPLPPVSLEELVPPDHFYGHLERSLDLTFVQGLVRAAYADIGRPSIDLEVFFKQQLILFFEGLRSERQLLLPKSAFQNPAAFAPRTGGPPWIARQDVTVAELC
jgi:hypothetical protein